MAAMRSWPRTLTWMSIGMAGEKGDPLGQGRSSPSREQGPYDREGWLGHWVGIGLCKATGIWRVN